MHLKDRIRLLGLVPIVVKPKWGQSRWAAEVVCPDCGKKRIVEYDKILYRKLTRWCLPCARKHKCRENHPNWKGGRNINSQGYIYLSLPKDDPFYCMTAKNGYVREHRYLMAKAIGRVLKKNEIVHHLNRVRTDNRLENLVIMSKLAHEKLHSSFRDRSVGGKYLGI